MVSLEIEILGKKYRFKSDKHEKIEECATHLNSLLDNISSKYGIIDGKDCLVLAAMDLADKLFQVTEESKRLQKELDNLSSRISSFFVEVIDK